MTKEAYLVLGSTIIVVSLIIFIIQSVKMKREYRKRMKEYRNYIKGRY